MKQQTTFGRKMTQSIALIATLAICTTAPDSHAGVKNWLNRKRASAKQKVNSYRRKANSTCRRKTQDFSRAREEAVEKARTKATHVRNTTQGRITNFGRRARSAYEQRRRQAASTLNKATRYSVQQRERIKKACEGLKILKERSAAFAKRLSQNESARLAFQNNVRAISAQKLAVAGFKMIPIYDPESGRVVTLDTYMREMINELDSNGSMDGSDLKKDPVACAMALCFATDGFDTMRIIKGPDGEWKTINGAMGSLSQGNRSEVDRTYSQAKAQYRAGNMGMAVKLMQRVLAKTTIKCR